VAGALRRVGGSEIEQEAIAKAPIPVGQAVYTTAGKLPYKYVIHAPTMEKPAQSTTLEKIRQATVAALVCADSYGVKVLAMPGMGTGVGGVGPDSAAEVMVETLRNYESASLRKVILVDKDPAMVKAFQSALLAERA
jgi:O-acetyl-ADP-ribose deacetylase (regulator of RNase III)